MKADEMTHVCPYGRIMGRGEWNPVTIKRHLAIGCMYGVRETAWKTQFVKEIGLLLDAIYSPGGTVIYGC